MAKRTCRLDRCDSPHEAHGLCRTHYARWRRQGDRALRWDGHRPTIYRFFEKVRPAPAWACWEWQGGLKRNGYGRIRHNGREMYVHRFAHEWFIGPIPDGLEVDHICATRHCVNPEHLQVTTHEENTQLAWERNPYCRSGRHLVRKHGYWRESGGRRRCRACENDPATT